MTEERAALLSTLAKYFARISEGECRGMAHEGLIHSLWSCTLTPCKGPVHIPTFRAWRCCIFVAHTVTAMRPQVVRQYRSNRAGALQSPCTSSGVYMHVHRRYDLGLSAIALPFTRSKTSLTVLWILLTLKKKKRKKRIISIPTEMNVIAFWINTGILIANTEKERKLILPRQCLCWASVSES